MEEEQVIERLWDTYQKLSPVRSLLQKEATEHSQSLLLIKEVQKDVTPLQINPYSKTYQVKIDEEVKKVKINEYKQLFYIYDQDQLITEGHIGFYTRDPYESIGITINIFSQIRKLVTMALGEMHKYRDGILTRVAVVEEVYILAPTECYMPNDKDFYDVGFHESCALKVQGIHATCDSRQDNA